MPLHQLHRLIHECLVSGLFNQSQLTHICQCSGFGESFPIPPTQSQNVTDTILEHLRIERLAQIFIHPYRVTNLFILFRTDSCQNQERNMTGFQVLLHPFRQFQSVHLRHEQVADNQVYGMFLYHLQSLHSVFGFQQLIVFFQKRTDVTTHVMVVVHNQYSSLCCRNSLSRRSIFIGSLRC